jgi:[protein-PII] uridylyltransferase
MSLKKQKLNISESSISNYKNELLEFNNTLDAQFRTVGIDKLLEQRSNLIDKILINLWDEYKLSNTDFSLNAVGGYGRQELHLHSDIDISIITSHSVRDGDIASLESFIAELWDLGLEFGHSVRTLKQMDEEIERDAVTATNMLDIRMLCGESEHARIVLKNLYNDDLWSSKKFWIAKLEEQKQRHYKLEKKNLSMQPDLKNSPGGLRDIQTIFWVARKHYSVSDPDELNRIGYFTNEEYSELLECQYFIWRVRWSLHEAVGRAENKLLFEYQANVASLMGFGNVGNMAIEKMMRQIFRAMKRVSELNQMLMLFLNSDRIPNAKNDIYEINNEFEIRGTLIHARHKDVFIDRKQIISMFVLVAKEHEKIDGISAETLRVLRQVRRRILGDLQDFYECRQEFIKLFRSRYGLGTALDFMHRHGVLSVYFPQWREIVGQMQFDLYHAYTVDEHTYRVLRNLHNFETKNIEKSKSFAANLYKSIDNKLPLKLAAMFHDIAKGRGGDHSVLGSIDAEQFAEFHDLRSSEVKQIKWLVKHHLLMSITAQQQDIFDIDVISEFAKFIGTQGKLDMLYCLTVADLSATNDNLWNEWKASLLGQLYIATKRALRNGLENLLEYKSVVKESKREALRLLENSGRCNKEVVEKIVEFWKKIPPSFFGRYDPDEIASYTDKIISNGSGNTLITVDGNAGSGSGELFVYIKDRKGLFVSLFKVLSNLNIATQEAFITVTKDDYVIETLKILDSNGELIDDDFVLQDLEAKLRQVLIEEKEIPTPKQPRFLQVFESDASVDFLKSRKKNKTLLSISSPNNPQLMEKICQIFQSLDLNIESAKINTIGEVVDNVFLLTNNAQKQLTTIEQGYLEDQLLQALR